MERPQPVQTLALASSVQMSLQGDGGRSVIESDMHFYPDERNRGSAGHSSDQIFSYLELWISLQPLLLFKPFQEDRLFLACKSPRCREPEFK